jgi:hypothetical protein
MSNAPMTALTGPAADALERNRDRLNARFAAARRAGAVIEPAAFLEHVATRIVPIVNTVAQQFPERALATMEALFDVSLELFRASMLGETAKSPLTVKVWREMLPQLAGWVGSEPRQVPASLSNAAVNLSQTPGTRPDEWMQTILAAAPQCDTAGQLLQIGIVAAWRAGMAHYRRGALATLKALPPKLQVIALGLPTDAPEKAGIALSRMETNPWLAPAEALLPSDVSIKPVAQVGAFIGFGGTFLRPPRVQFALDSLFATDGQNSWQLIADVFGSVLVRQVTPITPQRPAFKATVSPSGEIQWDTKRLNAPHLNGCTSFACDGTTLAVTIASSHHVFLFSGAAQ